MAVLEAEEVREVQEEAVGADCLRMEIATAPGGRSPRRRHHAAQPRGFANFGTGLGNLSGRGQATDARTSS